MKTESQEIAAGQRIRMMLEDEEVKEALVRLEKRYYEEFKNSKTAEDRAKAWAKSNVLDNFLTEMRIVISGGEAATYAKQRREARENRTQPSR